VYAVLKWFISRGETVKSACSTQGSGSLGTRLAARAKPYKLEATRRTSSPNCRNLWQPIGLFSLLSNIFFLAYNMKELEARDTEALRTPFMLHKDDQITIIDPRNQFCGARGTIKYMLPVTTRAQAYIVAVTDSTGLPLNLVLYREDMERCSSSTAPQRQPQSACG
jgi:hypothetical protein